LQFALDIIGLGYTSVTYKSYTKIRTCRNDNSEYCRHCFKLITDKQKSNTNDWTILSYYTNTEYALTVHKRYTNHSCRGHIVGGVSTVTYQSITIKPITCRTLVGVFPMTTGFPRTGIHSGAIRLFTISRNQNR